MQALISKDGKLVLIPETSTEEYALEHWKREASTSVLVEADLSHSVTAGRQFFYKQGSILVYGLEDRPHL